MLSLQNVVLAQVYVEERLAEASHERLLRAVERARRAQRQNVALKARVGRVLVRVGQRLEASTSYRDVELSAR